MPEPSKAPESNSIHTKKNDDCMWRGCKKSGNQVLEGVSGKLCPHHHKRSKKAMEAGLCLILDEYGCEFEHPDVLQRLAEAKNRYVGNSKPPAEPKKAYVPKQYSLSIDLNEFDK